MSVFSLCLGRMLCGWMNSLMKVMVPVPGLSGLVLLRLRLLMLFGSVAVLFPLGAWFKGEVVFFPDCSAWRASG